MKHREPAAVEGRKCPVSVDRRVRKSLGHHPEVGPWGRGLTRAAVVHRDDRDR